MTVGTETHVGVGDATPDNTAKLVALARMEDAAAKMALGPSGKSLIEQRLLADLLLWRSNLPSGVECRCGSSLTSDVGSQAEKVYRRLLDGF